MKPDFSVTFSYPHNWNNLTQHFVGALAGLLLYECGKSKKERILGSVLNEGSPYVDFNRGRLVSNFLNYSQDSHLLMIDPDISFAKTILEDFKRIITLYPEVGILGARVDIRNGLPVFYFQHPDRISTIQWAQPFQGIKEFDYVGAGVLLISREVLLDLYTKLGHVHLFSKVIEEDTGRILGDDLSFCKLAREKGHKVYGTWDIFGQHFKEFPVPSRYPSAEEVKITKR
jgi:hypothetical protein